VTNRILIVEDEEDILELLCAIFDDLGDYRILCTRDGKEALRIARVDNPDIILLDIQLTCPPKRSPVIMLANWDKKGGINGQKGLYSGANHQQASGS